MASSAGAPAAIGVTAADGRRGDFAPLLAIARVPRGGPATTRVAFLSNPHYAAEVEATAPGVAFAGVGARARTPSSSRTPRGGATRARSRGTGSRTSTSTSTSSCASSRARRARSSSPTRWCVRGI